MCRALIFLILTAILPTISNAQDAAFGAWYQYFGNQGFGGRWNWHNEFQYRNYNLAGDLEQLLFRTGIGYNLTEKNNNVLLGYAYVYGEPYISGTDEKTISREHRIYQQYLTRQHFGRFFLSHRYRFEERFINGDFRFRFRYGLFLHLPLNQPTLDKGAIYLSLGNEIFLHTPSPFFDRDRLYGAIGYALSKDLRIEAGYMIQFLETSQRGQLQLGIYNNTPFRKPAE
jgi:hypothetical protein